MKIDITLGSGSQNVPVREREREPIVVYKETALVPARKLEIVLSGKHLKIFLETGRNRNGTWNVPETKKDSRRDLKFDTRNKESILESGSQNVPVREREREPIVVYKETALVPEADDNK